VGAWSRYGGRARRDDRAIDAFRLTRVWASTEIGHLRSQRVLEKLGMRRECVRIADHVGRDGNPVDEVVYGMNVGAV